MPKPSAKVIARCEMITKYDGEGRLLLVGYRRKAGGRKSRREYWLDNPVEVSSAILTSPNVDIVPRDRKS